MKFAFKINGVAYGSEFMYTVVDDSSGQRMYLDRKSTGRRVSWTADPLEAKWYAYCRYALNSMPAGDQYRVVKSKRDIELCPPGGRAFLKGRR